jgi:hypothetical protein
MKTLVPTDLIWFITMCFTLAACLPLGLVVGCAWAVWRAN